MYTVCILFMGKIYLHGCIGDVLFYYHIDAGLKINDILPSKLLLNQTELLFIKLVYKDNPYFRTRIHY